MIIVMICQRGLSYTESCQDSGRWSQRVQWPLRDKRLLVLSGNSHREERLSFCVCFVMTEDVWSGRSCRDTVKDKLLTQKGSHVIISSTRQQETCEDHSWRLREKPLSSFLLISQNRRCHSLENDGKWVVSYHYLDRVTERKEKNWVIWCQEETAANRSCFSVCVLFTNMHAADIKIPPKQWQLGLLS